MNDLYKGYNIINTNTDEIYKFKITKGNKFKRKSPIIINCKYIIFFIILIFIFIFILFIIFKFKNKEISHISLRLNKNKIIKK